jgi:hypothetical protein
MDTQGNNKFLLHFVLDESVKSQKDLKCVESLLIWNRSYVIAIKIVTGSISILVDTFSYLPKILPADDQPFFGESRDYHRLP